MQRMRFGSRRWYPAVWLAAAVLLAFWARGLVWQAAKQLFLGMLIALAALPLAKWLEKKLSGGTSAALALAGLGAGAFAVLFLLLPPLLLQARGLVSLLPQWWEAAADGLSGIRQRLGQMGIAVDERLEQAVLSRAEEALAAAAPAVMNWMGGMAGGIGQWLLAPVFSYYFLKDRKAIAARMLSLLPVSVRVLAVRMAREMRRETAGYLRGQLLVSAIVGGLTAAGLLLCGLPSWLVLGVLLGVLELIPYAGPLIGGLLTALCALPGGWGKTLWSLGVVIAVQQVDSSFLSPRLLSQTTRLHPAAVVLCVVLGGAAAGIAGILFAIPLVLCVRAALRVITLYSAGFL